MKKKMTNGGESVAVINGWNLRNRPLQDSFPTQTPIIKILVMCLSI